jgi:pilus assembly protein Flp/PilA
MIRRPAADAKIPNPPMSRVHPQSHPPLYRFAGKELEMNGVFSKVRRFLVSEDGPTAVEYAVMLALIIVVCVAIIRSLGTSLSGTFSSVQSSLSGS